MAWKNAGVSDLSQRDDLQARYAWLRPLELLWVARTLESNQSSGQLPGTRSIDRWIRSGQQSLNFAMRPEQFQRYRQIGPYGTYRGLFRTVPGLTEGDGWTPASVAHRLADLVNDRLPLNARINGTIFENGTKWGHWQGKEARYWIERGWSGWRAGASSACDMLPLPADHRRMPLPQKERQLLEPALFGKESTTRTVASVLAKSKGINSHSDVCAVLAGSFELSKKLGGTSLAPLPAFSHFADTAMDAMRGLWNGLNYHRETQVPPIVGLARLPDLRHLLAQLREAGIGWLVIPESERHRLQEFHVVTRLAKAVKNADTSAKQIAALVQHHQDFGGGRRWFYEQNGSLVPLVAETGGVAANYRFRLNALSLLAAQCGVAKMDRTLDALAQDKSAEDDEGMS